MVLCSVYVADLDADGDLDIVSASYLDDTIDVVSERRPLTHLGRLPPCPLIVPIVDLLLGKLRYLL